MEGKRSMREQLRLCLERYAAEQSGREKKRASSEIASGNYLHVSFLQHFHLPQLTYTTHRRDVGLGKRKGQGY